MAQVKLTLPDNLARKFRQIAIAKHGTLNLKAEGEEAIRSHIQRNERWLRLRASGDPDALLKVIGSLRSSTRRDAFQEKKALYAEA